MVEHKKVGKKPIGKKALTGVEKNRRFLNRRRLLNEAAREHGHSSVTVLLDDMQLVAIKELEKSWGSSLTAGKLDTFLFLAIRELLKSEAYSHLKTPKRKDWPEITAVDAIHIDAQVKFNEWEKQ